MIGRKTEKNKWTKLWEILKEIWKMREEEWEEQINKKKRNSEEEMVDER